MITIIIRMELNPVILILSSTFRVRILSVTRAMDKPKESAILSMILTRLKKTSVQAKPGAKKTNINPRIALTMGMRSRKGKTNSNIDPSISCVTFWVDPFSNLFVFVLYILPNMKGNFKCSLGIIRAFVIHCLLLWEIDYASLLKSHKQAGA